MATGGVLSSITRMGKYEPFELQVARNQVYGHRSLFRFGFANAIGTTQQTIASSVAAGTTYVYPNAATGMTVSSSSANDATGGTGARTLLIIGLDTNYNQVSEVVALNGQTAVNTVNSYLRITYTEILSVGSGAAQAGTIYIGVGTVTAGVPATIYWQSEIAYNNWAFAGYTVPAGYTAYVTSYTITSQSTTANVNVSTALVINEYGLGFPEIQSTARLSSNGSFDRHFDCPIAVNEKCDFELRAWASTAGVVNVTGEVQIILVKNNADAGSV